VVGRWILALGLVSPIPAAVLAADQAVFTVSASLRPGPPTPSAPATLVIHVEVKPGWHVNSNVPLDPYLIPTRMTLRLPAGWSASPPAFPPHRVTKLAFSPDPVAVFEGAFDVTATVSLAPGAASGAVSGAVEAQACNDHVCLPPAEVPFTVAAAAAQTDSPPIAGASATAATGAAGPAKPLGPGLSAGFVTGGLALQLLIVFVAGLGLNLTPCVYPLIPITVGFFSAQKTARKSSAWLLAATYVLGMSVTYSALGVLAALTGRLFGSALQSPWVVAVIVAVLLALAASMFGLWEIRVPAWATRVSGGRSGYPGALLMGLVVGLVAAPCIGPFVLGLLTYVGQRQDVALGFLLFFVLSLGLGLPYLLLGVFTGAIDRLPNSGAWMLGIRQLFGVLLVALAGYFVRPFLPPGRGDLLFGGLLVLGGLYLLLVARPGHDQPWIDRAMRLASLAIVLGGILALPARSASPQAGLEWQPYAEVATQRAIASGEPVVLDFSATWCIPCKELDEKTFSDPRVAAALARFARFKVDLTSSEPATDALRQRYEVAGVPTLAFFRGGRELDALRLTGFEPAGEFLKRLERVVGS